MIIDELDEAVKCRMDRMPGESYRKCVDFVYGKYEEHLLRKAKKMKRYGLHKSAVSFVEMNRYIGWARIQSLEGKVDISSKYFSSYIKD